MTEGTWQIVRFPFFMSAKKGINAIVENLLYSVQLKQLFKITVMKKVLFLGIAVVGFTMMSCTKDYTCTWTDGTNEYVQDYNDLDKDEADAAESACTIVGGTFAEK